MVPVQYVAVVFQDDLWLIFVVWRLWFLKKVKIFLQILEEYFGDLNMSVFWASFGQKATTY